MDHTGYGEELKTEYPAGLSVDDILAEFQAQEAAPAPADPGFAYQDRSEAFREPEPPAASEADVRVYKPQSAVAAMEREARQLQADLAAGRRDEEDEDDRPVSRARAAAPEEEEERPAAPRKGGLLGRLSRGGRKEKKPRPARRAPEEEAPVEAAAAGESAPARPAAPAPAGTDQGAYTWTSTYTRDTADPAYTGYTNLSPDDLYDLSSMGVQPEAPAEPEEEEVEIDSRFDLDGSQRAVMAFNGKTLDLSAEENYAPREQAFIPTRYTGEGEAQEEEEAPPSRKKRRRAAPDRKRAKGGKAPASAVKEDGVSGFTDESASPSSYAPARDYDTAPEGSDYPLDASFPSFKEYLVSLVSNLLFRMRGFAGSDSTATMADSDEELGPELTPAAASKYYGAFVHSLRLRFRISLVLLLLMMYISLGLPVPGMLKSVHVASAMCLAMQLTVMLLSLDVVTGAIQNAVRLHFGADFMAVLACLLTSVDALSVAVDGFGSAHMPLCAVSSLSLCGVLLSSLLSARGLRKALRVPAIGKRAYTVTGEVGVKGRGDAEITLLKTARPPRGFVRRAEEAPPDETAFAHFSPLLLIGALVLSLLAAAITKRVGDTLYILTAVLSPAVPVTALLGFALPFCVGSIRIFSSGAAIAGWSGLCDIGQSRNLIVTDRDLFPEESVELESIRIFADESSDKVISYAGTMIVASGSSISACFGELMEKHGCQLRHVENFEYLAGGGMRGVIDGEVVLCGSSDLMRLMNVRIPFRLVEKTTVLLAIDGILYGIFNMKYTPLPQVRKALVSLMRSNRHPVFAIRDFNVTPEMLSRSFDLATDGYDFPPYVDRFAISEAAPSETSKVAAVVCREGLGPLTHMADTGRSMYVTIRINILLSLLSALIGAVAVFVKLLSGGVGVGFLLAFMLAWALPVAALSLFLRF